MKSETWFCINLGDANISQITLCEIKQKMSEIFEKHAQSKDMLAVFRHESQSLHCQTQLFLTKNFQKYLKLENAKLCTKPDLKHVEFLAGNKNY